MTLHTAWLLSRVGNVLTTVKSRNEYDGLPIMVVIMLTLGCLLLLFGVAASQKPTLSADRLGNLAIYLDDPFVTEVPLEGSIVLRPAIPPSVTVIWEISPDFGATYRHFQSGYELEIAATDVGEEGLYLRPSWRGNDGVLVPGIPY
ncbi:MAG: hypothetical protein EOP20_10730, partial [Hyphomicrobiales bacterium]